MDKEGVAKRKGKIRRKKKRKPLKVFLCQTFMAECLTKFLMNGC